MTSIRKCAEHIADLCGLARVESVIGPIAMSLDEFIRDREEVRHQERVTNQTRYCETCGQKMNLRMWIINYDYKTGKPEWKGKFTCPKSTWYSNGHNCYYKYFWEEGPEETK